MNEELSVRVYGGPTKGHRKPLVELRVLVCEIIGTGVRYFEIQQPNPIIIISGPVIITALVCSIPELYVPYRPIPNRPGLSIYNFLAFNFEMSELPLTLRNNDKLTIYLPK